MCRRLMNEVTCSLIAAILFFGHIERGVSRQQVLFGGISQAEYGALEKHEAGSRTYIVFINGDADHYVIDNTSNSHRLLRADVMHARRILDAARVCGSCNVVLLHIQRGGKRWYTGSQGWASYVRVFSGGAVVIERMSPLENAADPSTVSGLIRFAENLFPGTERHLIYIGHAFLRNYYGDQNALRQRPFAYSFPRSAYGIDTFVTSLMNAGLRSRLSSITLAACSMADLSLAMRLAPYTDELIASQFDVIEIIPLGFSFSGLFLQIRDDNAGSAIAKHLMDAFAEASDGNEVLFEYSVSEIDTLRASKLRAEVMDLARDITLREHWTRSKLASTLSSIGHVHRRLSARYLQSRVSDSVEMAELDSGLPLDKDDIDTLDVGALVRGLIAQTDDENIQERARAIESDVAQAVILRAERNDGMHSGLNIQVTDILEGVDVQ